MAMKGLLRFLFQKNEREETCAYDKENEKPIIRASICTGEKTAGFRDIKTGKFREVMLIRSPKDLDEFMEKYGLDSIDTEY